VRGGLGIRELRFHMLEGDFKVRLRDLAGVRKAETWAYGFRRTHGETRLMRLQLSPTNLRSSRTVAELFDSPN